MNCTPPDVPGVSHQEETPRNTQERNCSSWLVWEYLGILLKIAKGNVWVEGSLGNSAYTVTSMTWPWICTYKTHIYQSCRFYMQTKRKEDFVTVHIYMFSFLLNTEKYLYYLKFIVQYHYIITSLPPVDYDIYFFCEYTCGIFFPSFTLCSQVGSYM